MTSPHISPVRIPDLVGALNFRDMGGYPGTSWFDGVAREIWEPHPHPVRTLELGRP